MKVAQSCPTLHDRMDYTVHGIRQARILERVAFLFSRGSSQPRDRTQVSRMGLQNCYHNKTIHRIFLWENFLLKAFLNKTQNRCAIKKRKKRFNYLKKKQNKIKPAWPIQHQENQGQNGGKCWVGQKVCLGSAILAYGKPEQSFWPTQYLNCRSRANYLKIQKVPTSWYDF